MCCTLFEWRMVLLALIVKLTKANIDYCDPEMCPHQGKHVACDNDGSFSSSCTGKYNLEDMKPRVDLILQEHNLYRNMLAGGHVKCFYSASRMPVLVWDWDLAKVAEYNVKTCEFAHDQCRSTPEFPYVGQNIYYAKTTRLNVTVEEFIAEAIFLWFEEYLDADKSVLEEFRKTKPQTGHFTVLVGDRQNRVGCAYLNNLIPGKKKTRRMVIFTCNYPSTNIRGFPSYKSGPTTADCKAPNEHYESLCNDAIDPNDIFWYEN